MGRRLRIEGQVQPCDRYATLEQLLHLDVKLVHTRLPDWIVGDQASFADPYRSSSVDAFARDVVDGARDEAGQEGLALRQRATQLGWCRGRTAATRATILSRLARWIRELWARAKTCDACMQTRAQHVYMRASRAHGRNSSAIPQVNLVKWFGERRKPTT